ncbi:MAG: prepilin-type N-terminal cleavage/methylation domain-containing protein [Rubritalea sp.]|uniref:prepilin-type N-terminal cleavage/methylation domain-containing protein n=1 Tax=Rubritalea sp. TaxID=2109375 RepID=UPI003242957C
MKKLTHPKIHKGFSLVELLVVIAIIAVLAALSYPAITGAIKSAKITEGNKMAQDLVFAIEGFEQKYDYLPYGDTPPDPNEPSVVEYSAGPGGENIADLLKVLMGQDEDINPNNVRFFEFQAASNGINGLIYEADGTTPSELKDPFGNDFTLYIDYSGDRTFDLQDTVFSGQKEKNGQPKTIRSTSAIAGSPGPDKEFYDPATEDLDADDVMSF